MVNMAVAGSHRLGASDKMQPLAGYDTQIRQTFVVCRLSGTHSLFVWQTIVVCPAAFRLLRQPPHRRPKPRGGHTILGGGAVLFALAVLLAQA